MSVVTRMSLVLVLACLVAGCRNGAKAPLAEWAKPDSEYRPAKGSTNAFDGYALAAETAVVAAPEEADRVTFTPGRADRALAKLGPALVRLQAASRHTCEAVTTLRPIGQPSPWAKGWRLLGRGVAWRVERACEAGDWDKAVEWALVGTKFGTDLTQGDAATATLGAAVCRDVREALAPSLRRLPASQLLRLGKGLDRILKSMRPASLVVKNEERVAHLGVQFVQDARLDGRTERLADTFGRDARPAIVYLRDLPEGKLAAYFGGFVSEVRQFSRHWAAQSDLPRAQRQDWKPEAADRPWKRFARAFCDSVPAALDVIDVLVAKTRLLSLTAWATAQAKVSGNAPKSLPSVSAWLTTDPYSGEPLVYSASGRDFRIYSVGRDLTDNGGDTDESGESPDVVLEGPDL